MENWIITDTHFDHPNVLLYNSRPVLRPEDIGPDGRFASAEIKKLRTDEMNELMVENWNKLVGRKDHVDIIGDFAFNRHAFWANSLNGKKTLILGSHDKASRQVYDNCFKEVVNRKFCKIRGRFFDMNHCCQRVWERSHYGSIHLFGHSHGRLNTFNLSFDCGVDVPENDYKPLHIEEILRRASVREEEMRRQGRINTNERGKVMFYQDDLAYFTKEARNGTR